jgi:hypothetical protein
MSTGVEQATAKLERQLGEPSRLSFPEDWTLSSSWQRAQAAPAVVGPVNAAEFDVLLGYVDRDDWGDRHRVLFAIYDGEIRAECDCEAHRWRDWCAHIAHLWWRWSRDDLGVVDLDTDKTHLSPPWWLTVDDREVSR